MASFAIIFAFVAFACGQFINPPAGSGIIEQRPVGVTTVYHVGDILNVLWNSTNGAVIDLVIKQAGTPATQIDRTPNSDGLAKGAYTWRITTDGSDGGPRFDLTFNNAFRFNLYERGSTAQSFSTVYFNISNLTTDQFGKVIAASSSTTLLPITLSPSSTWSTVSSGATITAITSESPIVSSPATANGTPLSLPTSLSGSASSGLSTAAKIGLGAGLGIAGLAVLGGLVTWYRFLCRKRSAELNNATPGPAPIYEDPQKPPVQQGWTPRAELYAPT